MRSISSLTATIHSLAGVVENAIFSVNLVDGRAPASGIVFTEDITKIAKQQGRDAVGHGFLLSASRAAYDISIILALRDCASPHGDLPSPLKSPTVKPL